MTESRLPGTNDAARDALFAAIVDSVPEAIIVTTPQGEISFINRATETLLGYPAAEVVGQSIVMLVPPQPGRRADVVKWLARWAGEPQGEQSRYLDFQARGRDGREMPVDVRVSTGDVAGQARFFITVRDNTARRQEQIGFKENDLRAGRILLMAEDGIVSCNADQIITFFNLRAEAMFGFRAEEVLGKPLTLLLPPAARPGHPAAVEAFGSGPTASRMMSERQQVIGIRRSGEVFPVEAAITRIAVGGALTYTAHLRDITARKAAQDRLEESERRFHAMFDHAFGAIALLATDGTVLEINRAARALTVGGGTLVGRPIWELPWLGAAQLSLDDAERGRVKAAVEAAAAGEKSRFTADLSDGGATRKIDLSFTPIADETGKVVYILPEGREVTGQAF
jgi:PAS domain S-box-containing protein